MPPELPRSPSQEKWKPKKPTPPNWETGGSPAAWITETCSVASNGTDVFKNEFKKITGMSVEDSIKLYKEQTGEELTVDKIQKLFSDPNYANEQLMANKNLHTVYRDILNTNIPATEKEAIARGFIKLPWYKSVYHNPLYAPWTNSKYIDSSGHLESVYDGQGNLVTSKDYLGTFNFFGPDDFSGHKAADVDPYNKWGN